jgi:hypothetical protein
MTYTVMYTWMHMTVYLDLTELVHSTVYSTVNITVLCKAEHSDAHVRVHKAQEVRDLDIRAPLHFVHSASRSTVLQRWGYEQACCGAAHGLLQ